MIVCCVKTFNCTLSYLLVFGDSPLLVRLCSSLPQYLEEYLRVFFFFRSFSISSFKLRHFVLFDLIFEEVKDRKLILLFAGGDPACQHHLLTRLSFHFASFQFVLAFVPNHCKVTYW